MSSKLDRRQALTRLAQAAGAVLLMPAVQACGSTPSVGAITGATVPPVPTAEWDPVAFNKTRGAAGAIPAAYMAKINAADGIPKHLGKHLPYVPALDAAAQANVPAGYVPIMWGDAGKGYARHPNAPKSAANDNQGHWYNWIRARKAVAADAPVVESKYSDWPGTKDGDNGAYAVFGGGAITDDGGRNTIYMVALPKGVGPGDTIRVWAHCLTHGEYVDFVKLPEWIKV